MLTFGALSGLLSKSYTKKILKFSGVLIIVLGLIIGNRGFALAGVNVNPLSALSKSSSSVLGGASNAVVAQSLNIQKKLKNGENIIEFTPGDKEINFSCWMGMIRGAIKVVDKLDTVDTSKTDPSLPPASTGSSCCAVPVADGSSSGSINQSNIYGNDLSKVPTGTLVNLALKLGNTYNGKFKGTGYELQPLIVVTGNSTKTKLTFDLSAFDNAEGKYSIVDAITGEELSSFNGKKGINEVEFSPKKVAGYAIVKDNGVLGIIEVVDNLKNTDIEKIRNKYLNQQ